MRTDSDPVPHLGGKLAIVLFVFTLIAFVVESQLTQYVQSTLQYRQPFFLFYLVHSSFSVIFPLHFLYLLVTSKHSASSLIDGLQLAIKNHLDPVGSKRFPTLRFLRLVLVLTTGVTLPALLWFIAISLASVSDVTAIWNTNAFFAYIITVKLFKLHWKLRRLLAVSLATFGVIAVVYGGTTTPGTSGPSTSATRRFVPSAPLAGNLLTLVASIGYGLYQVYYKKYAALSSDPEVKSDPLYEPISEDDAEISVHPRSSVETWTPPFGLHPNLLTSAIGLSTAALLWIPIPILHYLGIETFRCPPNAAVVVSIAGIALGGIVFNAGFMILLGVWGPIITSVGNLLTIVLVLISDIVFGSGAQSLTLWGLLGSCVIVAAFAVLAYDMFTEARQ